MFIYIYIDVCVSNFKIRAVDISLLFIDFTLLLHTITHPKVQNYPIFKLFLNEF